MVRMHPTQNQNAPQGAVSSISESIPIKEADAYASASFYFALTGAKKKYKSPAEPCSAGGAPPTLYEVFPAGNTSAASPFGVAQTSLITVALEQFV